MQESLWMQQVDAGKSLLVHAGKVCLLLYIMLGLDKNFVKAMDHQGEGFKHDGKLFPDTIEAEIKHGICL